MENQFSISSKPQSNRRSVTLWAWLLIFVAVLTLFRLRDYEQAQIGRGSYFSEQNRLRKIDAACCQKLSSFIATFGPSHLRRATLSDLAQQFNAGNELTDLDRFGNTVFIDPTTGGHATIELFPDRTVSMVMPGGFLRSTPPVPAEPNITALVISFIAGIALCFVLLGHFTLLPAIWLDRSRSERIQSAWKLTVLSLITIHVAWMGSKFFPGWRPFGDAQILGYQLFFTSPTIVFLLAAYMSQRPNDGITRCHRSRYDLTGNTSGTCPECGTRAITNAAV